MNGIAEITKKNRHNRTRLKILLVLACVVVFVTTYLLILPAVTMEKEVCGLKEHTHTDACYETKEVSEQVLVCGQEESSEHTHTDACYETQTTQERVLVCGLQEHTHTFDCLSGDDQESVRVVNNLIEVVPDIDTYSDKYDSIEDEDEAQAYLEEVMEAVLAAYETYDNLDDGLKKYVTDSDKLMAYESLWGDVETYAAGDNLNIVKIYNVNNYESSRTDAVLGDNYDSIVYYNAGTSQKTVRDFIDNKMSFAYWEAISVKKAGIVTGERYSEIVYIVDSVDFSSGDKRDIKVNPENFVLLLHNAHANVSAGDRVVISSSLNLNDSAFNGDGLGYVNFIKDDKKQEKNNNLTKVKGANTRDLIEVNLYDYGSNINDLYNSNSKYPGFQQDKGTDSISSGNTTLTNGKFNFGNNITADLAAGKSGITNKGGDINTTANGANSPISGAMQITLGSDGYPALSDGTSLAYLFSNSEYATKKNNQSINGLFQYNDETGEYTFNSRKNHAQFNPGEDTFTLYNQIISSNFMMYPFGNFLPFNDIVSETKKSSEINKEYLMEIAGSAQFKADNGSGDEYALLAAQLRNFISVMDSKYPGGWDADECINEYFAFVPTTNRFTIDSLKNIYTIDYDEPTDFYFGMEMKMNFMQPKGGLTGNDGKQPMVFYFTGDDDVWVYLDGKLALDLSGIHRHVGGEIDFVNGVVKYYDLDVSTGDVSKTSSKTVKFSDLQLTSLNDKGTFEDYSTHSFNFYYMERGAGSGVCRMNFNFPLLKQNSISVTKELSVDGSDSDVDLLGNPDFSFQILKPKDGDSNPDDKYETYIGEGVSYDILDTSGNKVGTGTTGADGIFTIKAGQTAVFTGINENNGEYFVRELIRSDAFDQYGTVSVDGSSETTNYDVTVGSDTFEGVNSTVKDISNGSTVFYFDNKVDLNKQGSLVISKDVQAYGNDYKSKNYSFSVKLDGVPLPVGTKYTVGTEERTVEAEGIIKLKSGETAVISGILAGTKFTVSETESHTLTPNYYINDVEVKADDEGCVSGYIRYIDNDSGEDIDKVYIKVINVESGSKVQSVNIQKSLFNPDDNNHTYSFELKQVDVTFDDISGNIAEISDIDGGYTDVTKIDITGAGPVPGGFNLAYSDDALGDESEKKFYYKITEARNEETDTIYDGSVYVVEVTVENTSGDGLKVSLTNKWKDGEPYNLNDDLKFENKLGSYVLPETGGPGTMMFTIGGVLLILTAGLLLLYRRRKLS